jgi:hypothetical protein
LQTEKFILMKKVLTTAIFVISTITLVCCQTPSTEKEKSALGPGIEFKVTEHDFGTFTQGGNGSFDFEFTNTGVEPLVLTNVRSSCGCTIPSWPHDPIPAKGKEYIKVKYDTNRIGKFNKTITVSSNAGEDIVLKISGEINPAPAPETTTPAPAAAPK